jgi:hypothetical protein
VVTQARIVEDLQVAIAEVEAELTRCPDFGDLKNVLRSLNAIRADVEDHWPLTLVEQRQIIIGPWSARALDSPDLMPLVRCLSDLHTKLRPDIDPNVRLSRSTGNDSTVA